jgi:uridine phosphorylase
MYKPHVDTGSAPLPRYVLLPGDPGRVPVIGDGWEAYEEISFKREFRLARGRAGGVEIAACSTGIGAPSAEIALMDLSGAGADTFIRVGTCGALQPEIEIGTLVVQEGAVRLQGSPDAYCEPEYPAIADRDVTFALIEACEQLGMPYTVGLTASVDSFFAGQDNDMPVPLELPAKTAFAPKMRSYGVKTFEMEAAALFVIGRLIKRRCGSICAVASNRTTGERREVPDTVADVSRVANRAVAILAGWDAVLASEGRRFLTPSLLARPRR